MINGMAHICLSVENLDVMEEFYVKKLGLSHAFDFKGKNGERVGAYIRIGNRAFLEMFIGRKKHTVAAIRSHGVEVSEPMLGSDNSWQAWITDPEGNRIELHQYTPESWQYPFL